MGKPALVRIHVAQSGGEIVHFDGADRTTFKVNDAGEILVPPAIVHDILRGVSGASVVPETPAGSVKPESPAKEK